VDKKYSYEKKASSRFADDASQAFFSLIKSFSNLPASFLKEPQMCDGVTYCRHLQHYKESLKHSKFFDTLQVTQHFCVLTAIATATTASHCVN
jgi:hypothetical protein